MKKIVLSIVFCLCIFVVKSQDTEQKKGKSIKLIGGFGGPHCTIQSFENKTSFSIGGSGAMVFNNLFIGGFGEGTENINPIKSKSQNFTEYDVQNEIGGLWLGYIWESKRKFNVLFSAKTAWGCLVLNNQEQKLTNYDEIFVFIPAIELEKKISLLASVGLSVNYNIYSGINIASYSNNDFSKPAFSFYIRFGYIARN